MALKICVEIMMHPVLQAFQKMDRIEVNRLLKVYKDSGMILNLLYELSLLDMKGDLTLFLTALEKGRNINWKKLNDPDLAILLIIRWIDMDFRYGRKEEIEILVQRGNAIVNEKTPLFLKCRLLDCHGHYLRTHDNYQLGEKYILKALKLLKENKNDHYYILLIRKAIEKISRLTGSLIIDEVTQIYLNKSLSQHTIESAAFTIFYHHAKIGNLKEAEEMLNQMESLGFDRILNSIVNEKLLLDLHKYKYSPLNLLKIEKKLIQKYELANKNSTSQYSLIQSNLFNLCLTQLLLNKVEDATNAAKHYCQLFPLEDSPSTKYLLILISLSNEDIDYPLETLDRESKRGAFEYIYYFYYGQIEWIRGNIKKARDYFYLTWENIIKYKAENYLDIQLKLAKGISMSDWFEILQSKSSINISKVQKKEMIKNNDLNEADDKNNKVQIIGKSKIASIMNQNIELFSKLDTPVLILGETGTGKDLAARAIHFHGNLKLKPFLAVNCGAIAENLLETELFGHAIGAFTGAIKKHKGLFEEAGRGTVFLDEIGEISQRLQVLLLRVLETKEIRPVGETKTKKIHCRILAATNADLKKLIKNGKFRKDLYFRLNRLELIIAPLKEKKDDIILLADHFLNIDNKNNFRIKISEGLKKFFLNYKWPGNVRELKNTIEKMKILSSNKEYFSMEDVDFMQQEKFNLEFKRFDEKPVETNPEKEQRKFQPVTNDISEKQNKIENILSQGKFIIRRLNILQKLFEEYNKLTAKEISQITGFSPTTITKYLKTLCQQNFIEKMTPTKSPRTHYFQKF